MGDTDFHAIAQIDLRQCLEDYHEEDEDVYVASNLILYYKEGDSSKRKDPDILVAKGVGKHRRRSFRVWEEGTVPRVLFEIASRKTFRNDIGPKRLVYARIKVREYFVFDPEAKYLDPPLQGFRLVRGKSVPIKPAVDGSLICRELGLRLLPEGCRLRLIDLKTGDPILTRDERAEEERARADEEQARADEEEARAEEEQKRAEQEKARAEEERKLAEQERARAEEERKLAEQERARAEEERKLAAQERARAEEEKKRADEEKSRADALAAEVEHLRKRLAEREQSE
jgi:Uma2 family endonuclease